MTRETSILVALAALAAASFGLRPREAAAPAAETGVTAADPVAAATAADPAAGEAAPAATDGADRSRRLELPDGTFVDALNDAVDPAPLAHYWGPTPYSPIVGIERGAGVDWYRHADGSYSTTQMVWRKDLGREVAMTRVAHPGPTPPAPERR